MPVPWICDGLENWRVFSFRVIVVYWGFINCYYAPHKQIPVQLHQFQIFTQFFSSTSLHFCRTMLCCVVMWCLCVCVCVCVRVFVTFMSCVETNKHIFKIFHHRVTTPFLHTNWHSNTPTGTLPPNEGVERRWGRQKSRFWANVWLHCC